MARNVLDAHHHIWRKVDVPWLNDAPRPRIFGEYEALRRDYLIDEYKSDSAAFNVTRSIYMQANWAPKDALREAEWVNSVAELANMPNGIVAFADLSSPAVPDLLNAYKGIARVCGIRHQIHWHDNPSYAYVPAPDLYDHSDWQAGLREVTRHGYPFDLQIFPRQLEGAASMVARFPDQIFILEHAGMLDSRDTRTLDIWTDGIQRLAANPNVYCKLTGLGTFDRKSSVELIRPIVRTAIDAFGAERCIFGSNFPVEKMWTTYIDLCQHLVEALPALSEHQLDLIFGGTAARVYGIAD